MQDSLSLEIKQKKYINETLALFLAQASWTPAMGALLVSGVLPTPNCEDIPSKPVSVASPTLPASTRQLAEAQNVLDRWLESEEDRNEDLAAPQVVKNIKPHDFLMWCWREFDDEPDHRRPSWLA